LGFENPEPRPATRSFAGLNLSANAPSFMARVFLSTKHALKDLQAIIPCRSSQGHAISGLIFNYMDGNQECAGEVRLDSLCKAVQPDQNGLWSLVFKTRDRIYTSVSAVLSRHYEPDADLESVINLACSGELSWIWSRHQCYVMPEGQTSFPKCSRVALHFNFDLHILRSNGGPSCCDGFPARKLRCLSTCLCLRYTYHRMVKGPRPPFE
jgi:hypothetical protein